MQIDSGKTRQKCENKEKSNEEQIKNQLNQATNHISNNIRNSINLLKDQRNKMLDERQTRVKTHQLSNSLLENAYRIVQQSLALHTAIMKSETENHILKTADTEISRDKKNSSVRSQLTADTDEKECLQFQRHNSIIEKLTEDYELKKEHLMEKFKTKIKEIDHQIRSLRHKGKGILFKIDIDNATRSFVINQNETNQINLLRLENNQSAKTDERLFDVDFSLLRKNHERFYFNSTNQQYEPFVLKSYFDQSEQLKQ
ncbi:unnamed protein product [Didymodactylos carnosus]|uniref:Uncharacterized protein n=1 Tax=Didymodactylos carnosus TaxID=1234261 RepID=A0A8S2EVR2_9BILA|nr:unnamed protein product [Didymodactylos carnosus]CAF4073424.1 unnamed protein product [Didymodactylos carnosus]